MQQFANFLRRFPFIATLVTSIWRLGRPRFTAGVIGIVFNDHNEILLVEHVFHPKYPWGLPGGWVDRGEGLDISVARELREELQLEVTVDAVALVEIIPKYPNHIDIAFLCTAHNTVGKLSKELLGYRWTPINELPNVPEFHQHAIDRAIVMRT